MKWIFMSLAVSMVALPGRKAPQSMPRKVLRSIRQRAGGHIRRKKVFSPERDRNGQLGILRESPRQPELVIRNGESTLGFDLTKSIIISLVEEERYLILVGLLGLIVAELAVLISYVLTRPLRRLAWGW